MGECAYQWPDCGNNTCGITVAPTLPTASTRASVKCADGTRACRRVGPNATDKIHNWIVYCFDDEALDSVTHNMRDIRVRRLPLVSRDKRLVGIVSICDIAACADLDKTGRAVGSLSARGGSHSQTAH